MASLPQSRLQAFTLTLLQHWCGLFWPAVSQREKINCKALWLPLHLPGDKSSTPRNCTLTRDRQLYHGAEKNDG